MIKRIIAFGILLFFAVGSLWSDIVEQQEAQAAESGVTTGEVGESCK